MLLTTYGVELRNSDCETGILAARQIRYRLIAHGKNVGRRWHTSWTRALPVGTRLFAVVALSAAALYFMNADERLRLARAAVARLRQLVVAIRRGPWPHDAFYARLIERTRYVIVTPLLLAAMITISLAAGFGDGPSLTAWGANYTPSTTAGEWWRLATYTLVQGGFLSLLGASAALLSLGAILERLVGRIAFAAVYVSAGLLAGVVCLWTRPSTTVTAGASPAILGLYGLLAAVCVYGYLREPRLPFSWLALKRLAGGAAIFAVSWMFGGGLGVAADTAGLLTGLAAGLVIARGVSQQKAPGLRPLAVAAVAVTLVALGALPLRGTIDARPAIAQIANVESITAAEYAKAVESYTGGRASARELVRLIEGRILPALQADRARVNGLHGVPTEQTGLVTTARRYFTLREASWRRRVEGLKTSNARTLRDADLAERTALDTFMQLQHDAGAL